MQKSTTKKQKKTVQKTRKNSKTKVLVWVEMEYFLVLKKRENGNNYIYIYT